MKILKLFFLLAIKNYNFKSNKILDVFINNFSQQYMVQLNESIDKFFQNLQNTIQKEKSIGIVSYNKTHWMNFFNSIGKTYYPKDLNGILKQISYEDEIDLYYITCKTFPFEKVVHLAYVSQYKMKLLSVLNEPVHDFLKEKIFSKNINGFQIYNYNFQIIPIDESNANTAEYFKNFIGHKKIKIAITLNESIIIAQSIKDEFLLTHNPYLKHLCLLLSLLERALNNIENNTFFYKFKNLLLSKFTTQVNATKKQLSLPNTEDLIQQYGSIIPIELLNHQNQSISNDDIINILKIQNITLLTAMYNYIY